MVTDLDVLAHLAAENAWFDSCMAPHTELIETIFQEMRGRIKEADRSVPQKDGDWLYWIEFEEDAPYKKWWRRPARLPSNEAVDHWGKELILDEVALADGREYFQLGAMAVSPDGTMLAYSVDTEGSERFGLRFRRLKGADGSVHARGVDGCENTVVDGTFGNIVWSAAGDAVIYCLSDENWRQRTIKLHVLGSDPTDDRILYSDPSETFSCRVTLGAQRRWIVMHAGDHETSEVRLVPASDPTADPILVRSRVTGVEYDVDVRDETLFIHTNDEHENFRLATAPLESPGEWQPLIAGSNDLYLTGFELFADFYVIEGRLAGQDRIELRSYADDSARTVIPFPGEAYSARLSRNPEWVVSRLRLNYESMIDPVSVVEYHVAEHRLEVLKVQELPSGYNPSHYVSWRLRLPSRDGSSIPVSVVSRRDRKEGGPLHLYGYGAYGIAVEPRFCIARLSLLDRGFAFAIAHVRGGDELGRGWYKAGKLTERRNTFNDIVDAAQGLIRLGCTEKGRVTLSGSSAGGQIVGAVLNSDADLFGAAVAHSPFVDVLRTMLDDSLPLTPGEWPEWGNPKVDEAAFALIRSYCPYEQVRPQSYPPLLVTAGLSDPRVGYWEAAKWVARLRELKVDDNDLLLKFNFTAGHGGRSDRFDALRDMAEEFAFIISHIQG